MGRIFQKASSLDSPLLSSRPSNQSVGPPVTRHKGSPSAKLLSLFLLPGLLAGVMIANPPAWASGVSSGLLPVSLAAEESAVEAHSWHRWLWWPIILYLFWGMAHVCDEYFVRTIDVICDRFQIPDDVAGATLMALGCNGPEMALNTIAIFNPSDIGVGAVIGGEVFNVLVIIGTALLATPACYMPLKLGCFTFMRDVFFYSISVALLWWILRDGIITRYESVSLLVGAACYITTVIMSDKLRTFLARFKHIKRALTLRKQTTFLGLRSPAAGGEDDSDSDESVADQEMMDMWEDAASCADPGKGSVLGIREDFRNRMMDRGRHHDDRFMCIAEDYLLLSTVTDPRLSGKNYRHAQSGIVYDHEGPDNHHWHHGGLVNRPVYLDKGAGNLSGMVAGSRESKHGETPSKVAVMPGDIEGMSAMQNLHFSEQPLEVIPLDDVLYCERPRDRLQFNLHVKHHEATEMGGIVTLEFKAKDEAVIDAWATTLVTKLIEQRRRSADPPADKTMSHLLMECVEWFQFPIKFWLEVTVPNMDRPDRQHLYPLSFCMSMFWLAIFAYSVCTACEGIHRDFGISTTVLGFTVAAAGTSFPNVFSGMVVARQGKTSMAVANALGANVQNVFLALAVPWTIQSCFIHQGPFDLKVGDLTPAVLECYITLVPVVLVYLCCNYSLPRWSGWLFLAMYVAYVAIALGQESSGCPVWPLKC